MDTMLKMSVSSQKASLCQVRLVCYCVIILYRIRLHLSHPLTPPPQQSGGIFIRVLLDFPMGEDGL
jgi:hypothetical protein